MRRKHHQEGRTSIPLRLWTYAEAVHAVPYLRSIVGSLREQWLAVRQARAEVRRLDARSGRPDRHALILRAEADRQAELAELRLQETLNELTALGVMCLDPAKGLALIPFAHGPDLAWFVFDLFAPRGVEAWRLQADPLETRRDLSERLDSALVDEVFSSRSFDGLMPPAGRP